MAHVLLALIRMRDLHLASIAVQVLTLLHRHLHVQLVLGAPSLSVKRPVVLLVMLELTLLPVPRLVSPVVRVLSLLQLLPRARHVLQVLGLQRALDLATLVMLERIPP